VRTGLVRPKSKPPLSAKPIEIGGWSYPVGCSLVLNGYLIHHDPEIYPEPDAYRPERFLDEPPGTYTWIPFGGGRRRCLGASFAMLEMKIVLSATLQTLTLHPGQGAEVARRRNITVRPSGGATAVLSDRHRAPVLA
jgi:cytochrome P450